MENKIEAFGHVPVNQSESGLLHQRIEDRLLENTQSATQEKIDDTVGIVIQQYAAEDRGALQLPDRSNEIVLDLPPEAHDELLGEYITILQEYGIHAALSAAQDSGNVHLVDDLHRFLVAYIKAGYLQARKTNEKLLKRLQYTVFEIAVPDFDQKEIQDGLKMMIARMEQFISGLNSLSSYSKKSEYHFALEVAQKESGEEYVFYVAIPDFFTDTFEKQLLAVYPSAHIHKEPSDYNIFNPQGHTAIGYLTFQKNFAYPLRTYEEFEYDPMNIVLNTFSKIQKVGEGIGVQYVCRPTGTKYADQVSKKIRDLSAGKKASEVLPKPMSLIKDLTSGVFDTMFKSSKKDDGMPQVDQSALDAVKKKIQTPVMEANVRIVASAFTFERAEQIIKEVASAFSQFESPTGNVLKLTLIPVSKSKSEIEKYIFREFSEDIMMPLSVREIATMYHFPLQIGKVTSQTKVSKSKTVPIPVGAPAEGIVLGVNVFQDVEKEIHFSPADRLRHLYVVGQTGTGKTTILKNMIIQDIKNGEGVCFIDPHGSDVQEILANIPPERADDLIYFDPGSMERPMGLNMLEYDVRFPEQKTFVVNEMMSIFNKLFDMKVAGGPMFEQYFRNACMLVIEDPDSGNTLLDISKVLADKSFRELKLSKCKNPLVVQFWREIADKAGGEASLANIIPYITSKFDVFLSNEIMRPIVSQSHSSFDFRQLMDSRKILLVNLAKGRLGEINSSLLGLILVGKILMAALSRVDTFGQEMPPFYLYIDEFQNVTTPSISSILSEARKYGLSLNVAHQFIKQLEEPIKDSVFGNVGSMVVYRVGSDDAELLAKQFEGVFTPNDIINLPNHTACLRLMTNGQPVSPFTLNNRLAKDRGDMSRVEPLKELSALKYGRPRAEVEEEVMRKFLKE